MINEDDKKKIRLMSKIAIYEKNEGSKNEKVADYFRSDYIAVKILTSIISVTLVFGIIVGLYVLCNSEDLMMKFYQMDTLVEMGKKLVYYYIGFLVAYIVVVIIAFFVRYSGAVKYKRVFSKNLKKLLFRDADNEEDDIEDETDYE